MNAKTKRRLKSSVNANGYHVVRVKHKSGSFRTVSVHRLIALAFIRNDEGKKQVNHIDGNKKNNSVDNLEWVTASENMKHAFRRGLVTVSHDTPKNAKKVILVDCLTNEEKTFSSRAKANVFLGFEYRSHVVRRHGKSGKPVKGFIVKFIDN